MKKLINKFIVLIFMVIPIYIFGQEPYNNCNNALELCPNKVFTVNNIDANATVCSNCEDDFNFCFTGENSIWLSFTTNDIGGTVFVDFSNIVFENAPGEGNSLQAVMMEATLPCISSSYKMVSECVSNATTNFQLSSDTLQPNTTYFIVVNGSMGSISNAEATFDVQAYGQGIDRNPVFYIGTESSIVCKGNSTVFDIHLEGCEEPSTISWYVNGELTAVTEGFLVLEDELQDQDVVSAKISCFEQCRDTLTSNSLTLTVMDFPVDAGPDKHIIKGESVQLNGYSTETDILWTPTYHISDTSIINPIVAPEETTTYFLTVRNDYCTITDEVTVFVNHNLEIPNTFTPNGDGINDFWDILGIAEFPNCHIQIFTRWGQMVYETTGYNDEKRWDGTTEKGAKLSEGAYYYVINLRDDSYEKPLKGTVTIVR